MHRWQITHVLLKVYKYCNMNMLRWFLCTKFGTALFKFVSPEFHEQNIKSNMQYRQYLQNNALNIMKNNQLNTCDECGICPYYPSTYGNLTQPFFYSNLLSNNSPFGYNNSDLKNKYLSRQTLQSRLFTPISIKEN